MFLLSCGYNSVSGVDVEQNDDRDTDQPRLMAAVTPLHERPGSGASSGVSFAGSRSDRTDEPPSAPFRRLDQSMSNYDSMATRLKTASRTDFSSLWYAGESSYKRKETLTTSSVDGEELLLPDQYIGQYQYFCQPQTWSSVFSSPGDFTVRVDAAYEQGGEVMLRIAVVCCSIRSLKETTEGTGVEATKKKSYVKFIERSERDLIKFSEMMALKYLGHRLMDKLPKLPLSVLSSSQSQLDAYADGLTNFLVYVLSITEIGYNRLLVLTEPVVKNLLVREFFDLSLGFGDPGLVSTSSCDARLERRGEELGARLLPSAWFDVMDGSHSKSFQLPRRDDSPRRTRPISGRRSDSGYEFRVGFRSPQQIRPREDTASEGKCIRFVKPGRWSQDRSLPGAFTVEITSVSIVEGRAKYTVCVFQYIRDRLEISTVDRRFSEFDSMVHRIEAKLRAVPLRNLFPAKTMFRYLAIGYLEQRAAYLQRFLERLLQMRFMGVLDEEVTMVAEPNVRQFLNLPSVRWSITPWRIHRSPRMHQPSLARRLRAEYPDTPISRDFAASPNSNTSNETRPYDNDDLLSPHFYDYNRSRNGSM